MNLNNFKNSAFFTRGQRYVIHNFNTNELQISQPLLWFHANVNLANSKIINKLYQQDLCNSPKIRFDFQYLLTISSLEKHVKDLLLNQYFEVKNSIESMQTLPYGSFLIIMPPNTYIGHHQHHPITKQTISFIYTIDYYEPTNYIEVANDKYHIPIIGNKFLLNMYDNAFHACNNMSGWTFIWANDYDSVVDIPKSIQDSYTLLK